MANTFDLGRMFIFEMANNHNGDVRHGLEIVKTFAKVSAGFPFRFAFKLQYRDLDSFIHPSYKGRKDIKYVKRFEETRLEWNEMKQLRDAIKDNGFLAICTPFDEKSVDMVEQHGFDVIKIASCSFTDWPLLERISLTAPPIIASTAGVEVNDIDRVVDFFEHRRKRICVMHCVGEYPTLDKNLNLNQIGFLTQRYPGVTIGFSSHEQPDRFDPVRIAIAMGARVFERHVGIGSKEYPLNLYSSSPENIKRWLEAALETYEMLGVENERCRPGEKEKKDLLGLRRGVFAGKDLKKGERASKDNVFFAIPCKEGQLTANDMSKYSEFTLKEDVTALDPIENKSLILKNQREKVLNIVKELKEIILKSHLVLPGKIELELSHHYGLERFNEYGAAILNFINREYCKKIIILLPGQKHPFHFHKKKEETFHVLYGSMEVTVGGENMVMETGDILTVERGVNHNFSSTGGVVFEEVSTKHYKDDSFYEDREVAENKERKTGLTFRSDWLSGDLR